MGSPAYMSPEQCKNSADVDLRSDIYSFAIILYEMLTGRTPYVATSGTELLVMHLTETPRRLRELIDDVPAHVEAAVARALARARGDRFDSMASFLGALRGNLGGSTAVLSPPSASEAPPAPTASPVTDVERTVLLPAATTFSRATGEVGEDTNDESPLVAKRSRHWIALALGGVAVPVLAILLLARPRRDSEPRGATGAANDFNRPSAVVDPTELAGHKAPTNAEPVAPVALPSKDDAGTAPSAVVGTRRQTMPAQGSVPSVAAEAPPTSKRGRVDAGQAIPSRAIKKKREEEKEWIGH